MSMFVITEGLIAEKTAATPPPPAPPVIAVPEAYATVKTVVDWIAALFLVILTAPLVLFAMILVKLTSPGPVIYTQTRVGQYGRIFKIYKLRTMTHNCESLTGAQWCKPGDSRHTVAAGCKTHIDNCRNYGTFSRAR